MIYTDIDERTNRIMVGVSDGAAVVRAAEILATSGLDVEMLRVVVAGTVRTNSLLTDPLRPVPAGASDTITKVAGHAPCTHGFNMVKYVGSVDDTVATDRYFISASHCSENLWFTETSQFWQGNSFFANEIGDPAGSSGGYCNTGKTCRYSEASVNRFLYDSIAADFPRVAFPSTTGSISFTSYRTVSSIEMVYVGQPVIMIGATNGRRSGTVMNMCADFYPSDVRFTNKGLLCQGKASYFGGPGDSGAPVVQQLADGTVGAVGIHWADQYINNTYSGGLFNPITQALDEFFYGLSGYPYYSPILY